MFDVWFSLYNIHWNSLKDVKKKSTTIQRPDWNLFQISFWKIRHSNYFFVQIISFLCGNKFVFELKISISFCDTCIYWYTGIHNYKGTLIYRSSFLSKLFFLFLFFFCNHFLFIRKYMYIFFNWKFPLVSMMTINAYNNRTLLNKLIELNLIM